MKLIVLYILEQIKEKLLKHLLTKVSVTEVQNFLFNRTIHLANMLSKQALLNFQTNQVSYQNLVANRVIVLNPFDNLIDDDLQNIVKKLQEADYILQLKT